jgi:hypothetical protein
MIKRTFDALGYKINIYRDRDTHKSPPSLPKDFYKEKIVSSIDNGFPVRGLGLRKILRTPALLSAMKITGKDYISGHTGTMPLKLTNRQAINIRMTGISVVTVLRLLTKKLLLRSTGKNC